MNSIKQVPTRVRSRRVEANLGAEREHFEKQQVNAENRVVVFLWETVCCYLLSQWLRRRECARACGGDGTGSHAHLLQLEIWDFSLWIKYLGSKTTLEGVYFTMRAWPGDAWCHLSHHSVLTSICPWGFSSPSSLATFPPPHSDTLSYSGCVVGNQPSGAGPEQIWPFWYGAF